MNREENNAETGLEIAVIGMSCRFPGAKNSEQFWNNVKEGVESIHFLSRQELEKAGVNAGHLENIDYVRACVVLEDKEYFDAAFFGYKPREADMMDPQMRLVHETSWYALEDAGYNPLDYHGLIGLYMGSANSAAWQTWWRLSGENKALGDFNASQLTDARFLSTRVSYKLDLKGPALDIFTTCSTGLVAVHIACRALLTGECDMALAGAVAVSARSRQGYLYQEGLVFSPDGHCRAFDASARGTVFGEGVGIVVLKRLKEAVAAGDHIYALVKGSAINNDGIQKVNYTAPGKKGQQEVIAAALDMAGVETESIGYVETHGTGTSIGDPIEIEALKDAFNTNKKGFCAIGSVKTNIGHLDTAAGIAGFIKTALALKHRFIPPSLHFKIPNPNVDFENSPFYVNTGLKVWKNDTYPLRAGVSSFGIGGTNAHVVLEEWPGVSPSVSQWASESAGRESREYQLILFSAKTETALEKMTGNLADYFKKNPGINLADAAYTLQIGRKVFPHRKAMVCANSEEGASLLSSPDSSSCKTVSLSESDKEMQVVFLFPGQGAQYVNMGMELYAAEPVFREETDRCFDILKSLMDDDIKEILYSPTPCPMPHAIDQTEIAQPLLFVFEYALAKLLMKWGIQPFAMIGHSIGEYVAACLSGVLSLEDALRFVVLRGRLMQQMPPGSMLSVPLPQEKLEPLLNKEVELAAVNGPSLCVVSGTHQAIDAFESQLAEKGIDSRRLHTSHAFHSRMMNPILKKIEETAKQIRFNPPQIPYISNITGYPITFAEVSSPDYWSKHAREPVRFSDGVKQLLEKGTCIFLEIGPGRVLSTFVKKHFPRDNTTKNIVISMVRHPKEKVNDEAYLLDQIGQLWLYGLKIDWQEFYHQEKPQRISLPTYPFEKHRFWIDGKGRPESRGRGSGKVSLQENKDISDWFYVPSWKRSLLPAVPLAKAPEQSGWLVFARDSIIGPQVIDWLKTRGHKIITVKPGPVFTRVSDEEYIINPAQQEDYHTLMAELAGIENIPDKIIHLWSVDTDDNNKNKISARTLEKSLEYGFFSLLFLVKALGKHFFSRKIQVAVVTNNIQEVGGEEFLCPDKAPVLGLIKTIPREYPNIWCKSVDIDLSHPGISRPGWLCSQLVREFALTDYSPLGAVAYRMNHRWVEIFEPVKLDGHENQPQKLKEQGVYLVTGGLGGIGLVLAQYLAKAVKARLVLTGRSDFPQKEHWEKWLDSHEKSNQISVKIQKIQALEETGAEVMIFRADAAHLKQMQTVITRVKERFGSIDGVIHCAGIADQSGIIQRRTPGATADIFKPKIKGTLVLDHLLTAADLKPDFLILCSSMSTILAPPGQVGYTAANAFLDAYAYYKAFHGGITTVSINWDTWKQVGMAVEAVKNRETFKYGVLSHQGVEAFQRILDANLCRAVFSAVDLTARIEEINKRLLEREDLLPQIHPGVLYKRPEMDAEYQAPRDQLEKIIVDTWQEILGLDRVGIYDNFFDLGANSLDIIQAHRKLTQRLNLDIPVDILFEYPSIASLAGYLNNENQGNEVPDEKLKQSVSKMEKAVRTFRGGKNGANRE